MAQKKFIIDGGFNTNADSSITGNLDMTGHIIPTVDSDGVTGYDLGTPDMKWRDLYLSQGSLYIDGQKVLESDSGTIVVQADTDQSMTVKTTGTGVLTLQSEQTVNFAATMQMAAGKKITSSAGEAVVFGDKIDLDNNQMINVGLPTEDGHATTKGYVDGLINNISTDAITEGDTEIEIADLGTGTVGFTVDGTQKLALSSAGAAFTVPVTVNGVELADVNAVSSAVSSAESYTDAREVSITNAYNTAISVESTAIANAYATAIATSEVNITTAYQTYTDSAKSEAESYTDSAVANLVNAAPGALDTLNELAAAMGDDANFASTVSNNIATAVATAAADASTKADAAESNATTYTDARETAITSAYQSYADAAEAAAEATASADATAKADAAQSAAEATASADATAKADAAQSAAEATASADATAKADAAVATASADATAKANSAQAAAEATASADATAKANAAQAAAEATASADASAKAATAQTTAVASASADATAKANAAEAAANTYTDTQVSNVINGAPGALDTLNELAAALGDDANFASTVTTQLNNIKSAAVSSFTTFHERGANFTDIEAAGTPTRTFSSLSGAAHYDVYLNRVLLRGPEAGLDAEYTVSGTTITFNAGVVSSSDNIEVRGFTPGTIA